MKVLIEVEHLQVLKEIAETFVDGTGGEQEEQIHEAIFAADMLIQGVEEPA